MPGLLGRSGGAGEDDFAEVCKPALLLFALAATAKGLVGMGGGAGLPLFNAAGPDAIRLSTVGDVEIALRSGAPTKAEPALVELAGTVEEAGVELTWPGARSASVLFPSVRFLNRSSTPFLRKGFDEPGLTSSPLPAFSPDTGRFHHCWCSSEGSGRLSSSDSSEDTSPPPAIPLMALFCCSSCFRIASRLRWSTMRTGPIKLAYTGLWSLVFNSARE